MSKNNMRLISVVMKSNSKENRTSDTIGMMEYGYSMYGSEIILKKDNYEETIKINNSEKINYKYTIDKDVKIIVDKNTRDIKYSTDIKINNNLKAPLKKGDTIGKLILKYDKDYEYNLILKEDVKKAGYFKIFNNHLKDLITGNVRK